MITASLDSKNFENKLKVFSTGLGNIFNELLKPIGEKMANEAKALAPQNTGKLYKSINFIFFDGNKAALTTRKKINKSNAWYSNIREHGAFIEAKEAEYLMFKVNGEWKKVKSVRTRAQPFMKPVWENYFGDNGKGFSELAENLRQKMNEELK